MSEIKVVINDIPRLTAKIAELETEITQLNAQITDLETQIQNKDYVIETLTGRISELEGEINTLQGEVVELSAQIATLTTQNQALTQQIQTLNEQISSLNTQITNMNSAIETINGETVLNPISYLAETKAQILTALQNKGSSATSSTTFRQYASEITAINTFPPEETTLLLHLDSDNGLNDSSSYHRPILTCGTGTPTIVTTESKFGNGSLYLDGTCGLYVNQTNFFPFQMPEWTFECFFKPIGWTTSSTYAFFGTRYFYNKGTSYQYECFHRFIYYPQYTVFQFFHENITSPYSTNLRGYEFTASMPSEEWHHLAITKNSLDATYFEQYYLDGVALPVNPSNPPNMYNAVRDISIFHNIPNYMGLMCYNAQTEFNRFNPCYVNEIRFSSVCRYTSAFTPPTQPFSV